MPDLITGVFASNASRFQTLKIKTERKCHVQSWFGGDLAQFSIFSNVYIKKSTFMEKWSWTTSFKKRVGFPNFTYFDPSAWNCPSTFLIQLWKCGSTFLERENPQERCSNALESLWSLWWSVDQPKMERESGETWIIVRRRRERKSMSFESWIEIIWFVDPSRGPIPKLGTWSFEGYF